MSLVRPVHTMSRLHYGMSLVRPVHTMRTVVSQVVACNLYLSGQLAVHNDGEFMEAIPLSTWLKHKTTKGVLRYKQTPQTRLRQKHKSQYLHSNVNRFFHSRELHLFQDTHLNCKWQIKPVTETTSSHYAHAHDEDSIT